MSNTPITATVSEPVREKRPTLYAILAHDHEGNEGYVRMGATPGKGPIATFPTRQKANDMLDFIWEGVSDEYARMEVVRAPAEKKKPAAPTPPGAKK